MTTADLKDIFFDNDGTMRYSYRDIYYTYNTDNRYCISNARFVTLEEKFNNKETYFSGTIYFHLERDYTSTYLRVKKSEGDQYAIETILLSPFVKNCYTCTSSVLTFEELKEKILNGGYKETSGYIFSMKENAIINDNSFAPTIIFKSGNSSFYQMLRYYCISQNRVTPHFTASDNQKIVMDGFICVLAPYSKVFLVPVSHWEELCKLHNVLTFDAEDKTFFVHDVFVNFTRELKSNVKLYMQYKKHIYHYFSMDKPNRRFNFIKNLEREYSAQFSPELNRKSLESLCENACSRIREVKCMYFNTTLAPYIQYAMDCMNNAINKMIINSFNFKIE